MGSQRKIRIFAILTAAMLVVILTTAPRAAVYQLGSRGDNVRTIQTKLKRWGYYNGSVDGVYGKKTADAVRRFQQKNGLTVDGVCGEKTLAALGIGGSSVSAAGDNDLYLLARAISAEARGEPYIGQVAVGAVILNRVKHPSFPSTVAGVIYQSGAFSSVSDGQFAAVTITDSARKAARDALNGWDPTGGAIYFYNPAKSTSKWIFSRPVVLTIGDHVFAK
ncbi:MAG: spore cortex-lytic enzyme [Clostridia bacterium]|nr:spore cortex-lytic enzyme [Clostridia bacterium]